MKNATVDSMRLMQMDDYSMRAHDVLPALLKYIDRLNWIRISQRHLQIVKNWDKHFAANSKAPAFLMTGG